MAGLTKKAGADSMSQASSNEAHYPNEPTLERGLMGLSATHHAPNGSYQAGYGLAAIAQAYRSAQAERHPLTHDLGIEGFAGGAGDELDDDLRHTALERVIEGEIIPRLLLSNLRPKAAEERVRPATTRRPTSDEVTELARLILQHDIEIAASYITVLRSDGLALESVMTDLLPAVARHFGQLWNTDRCLCTEVTIGVGCLQRLLHRYSEELITTSEQGAQAFLPSDRFVLVAPLPGDPHTFGSMVVAERFRSAGWYVGDQVPLTTDELIRSVREQHYDVIALTLASETRVGEMTKLVSDLRHASRQPNVMILVGGPVFISHPDWVSRVAADGTALDAHCAVQLAESWLTSLRAGTTDTLRSPLASRPRATP